VFTVRYEVNIFVYLCETVLKRKLYFNPRRVHVTFVVDKVALEQVFPRVLWISPVNIISSTLQTHLIDTLINRKNRSSLKRFKQSNDSSKI